MLVQTVCRLGIVEAESVLGELVDALNNVCCADGLSFHIFHKVCKLSKRPLRSTLKDASEMCFATRADVLNQNH